MSKYSSDTILRCIISLTVGETSKHSNAIYIGNNHIIATDNDDNDMEFDLYHISKDGAMEYIGAFVYFKEAFKYAYSNKKEKHERC